RVPRLYAIQSGNASGSPVGPAVGGKHRYCDRSNPGGSGFRRADAAHIGAEGGNYRAGGMHESKCRERAAESTGGTASGQPADACDVEPRTVAGHYPQPLYRGRLQAAGNQRRDGLVAKPGSGGRAGAPRPYWRRSLASPDARPIVRAQRPRKTAKGHRRTADRYGRPVTMRVSLEKLWSGDVVGMVSELPRERHSGEYSRRKKISAGK